MTKRARRKVHKLNRRIERLERKNAKDMAALKRETISAVHHILQEWLTEPAEKGRS